MADDGKQVFVSTPGDIFRVKVASAGNRSIQFIGSVSDNTLQKYLELQSRQRTDLELGSDSVRDT